VKEGNGENDKMRSFTNFRPTLPQDNQNVRLVGYVSYIGEMKNANQILI
jgi:hypothetical protein